MPPKGLSLDEKRNRMLEWFYETKQFYQLKEVEKLCSKAKGIASPTIKEVLISLVDEGLVFSEKIGTSNYFWSYPSAASIAVKNKLESVRKQANEINEERNKTLRELMQAKKVKEGGSEGMLLFEAWKMKHLEEKLLQRELDKFTEVIPQDYSAREKILNDVKAAAERWAENISCLLSFINGLGIPVNEVRQSFQISEEYEEIVWEAIYKESNTYMLIN